MCWLAVDKNGDECLYINKPYREKDYWDITPSNRCNNIFGDEFLELQQGFIEDLIGRKLTWNDEPVELKEVI